MTKETDNSECVGCKLADICKQDCVTTEKNHDIEMKAILLCLVIPCVLLLGSVIMFSITLSTLTGCLAGICLLVIYYGLFYLLKRMKRK